MEIALKVAILKSGLKQSWIAERIGMDDSMLSAIVTGRRKADEEQKRALSELLGWPVETLFDGGE